MSNATADLDRVQIDPEILAGTPVIRGTRMPVYLIVNFVESGQSPAAIIDAYPQLTEADIAAALAFAKQEQDRTEVRTW